MSIFSFQIGNLTLAPTWYGLMYALGFLVGFFYLRSTVVWKDKKSLDSLLFFIFLGVILGGRLGYVFLYNAPHFLSHPLEIFAVWNGGMSFHGGFIGVLIGVYLFCKKYSYQFWGIMDTLAIITPIAIGLGRIGNWINGELPGYAIYRGPFPMIIDGIPHFPNPLLEMFLEGVVLFIVLFLLSRIYTKKIGTGFFSGVFLSGYALARLTAEIFRLPDAHIGYLFETTWITLGILYTLPMLVVGAWLIIYSLKNTNS